MGWRKSNMQESATTIVKKRGARCLKRHNLHLSAQDYLGGVGMPLEDK